MAGLYALERLAQDNLDRRTLRQTVVDVLCAYLRMPYTLPGKPPEADADTETRTRHENRVQEREVRLTAQCILARHLHQGPTPGRSRRDDRKHQDHRWDVIRAGSLRGRFTGEPLAGGEPQPDLVVTEPARPHERLDELARAAGWSG